MERTEAIEVVRKNWPSEAFTMLREALETLIPELKESEDERIRKAILGLTYLDGIEPILTKCSITAGDIRAYLEKQKEQNLAEVDESTKRLNDNWMKQHFFEIIGAGFLSDDYEEQKPAKWSEEDEKKIIELKTFIARCNGFNKENRKKAFDMIDAIGPRPSWKPSEEQIEALERCAEYLEESDNEDADILAGLYEHLKKLM